MEIVRQISKIPTDMQERPKIPVTIVESSEIDPAKDFLRKDPF